MIESHSKILVFTCNWEAYAALEGAGAAHDDYPVGTRALRLPCLGSIGSNDILSALRHGADGVLLLACPEDRCHYETGSAMAEKTFDETVNLLRLAGLSTDNLEFHRMPLDGAVDLVGKLRAFENRLLGRINGTGQVEDGTAAVATHQASTPGRTRVEGEVTGRSC